MKKTFSFPYQWWGLLYVMSLFLLPVGPVQAAGDPGEFKQPIAFSHKTHAGQNEVPCEYCHIYARRSIVSGVPPVRTCIGCHAVVKGSTPEQQKEIQKVVDYWDQKKPIPWKKIHDVADFVYFSHKRHVKIGFDCTECHGDVKDQEEITMDNMKVDLSMGWCVECHKIKHPTINKKILSPVRVTRGGPLAKTAQPNPDGTIQGSKDCLICHK